ncbi:hypothetical protein F442_00568 [Phytophthora nicotianae P10297]|uniref:Uncharacterized protein n=1 Tax=Phytophthora nicotianae P10297 TaxID=1317064 RepID=W3A5B0_PHYNI|nr:hypothetical protein F442_00568 [Phytophthora nicotianae P10297]
MPASLAANHWLRGNHKGRDQEGTGGNEGIALGKAAPAQNPYKPPPEVAYTDFEQVTLDVLSTFFARTRCESRSTVLLSDLNKTGLWNLNLGEHYDTTLHNIPPQHGV